MAVFNMSDDWKLGDAFNQIILTLGPQRAQHYVHKKASVFGIISKR